jgi:membrane protease YdiL (CAAX protease family)
MLFLLKRTAVGGLAALVVLAAAGVGLRWFIERAGGGVPELKFRWDLLGMGVVACGVVLCGDALIHTFLRWSFGDAYLRRYAELAGVFRGQTVGAMVAGAAMAGVGEELVFRGLSAAPWALAASAVAFGLLHHVRQRLWPFTLWSVWEGALFGVVLYLTGQLAVTMTAHFLHDLLGFLIFRRFNRDADASAKRR